MPSEIERKFLVSGDSWRAPEPERIVQGYLNRDKQRTVRIRIAGSKAFLAIKGIARGATRSEFEYEIPLQDAEQMLSLCDGPMVEKLRHRTEYRGCTWEVDEFLGDNQGLVVAEVELDSENQKLELPSWVTTEVTTDARYFNSNLATNPHNQWRQQRDAANVRRRKMVFVREHCKPIANPSAARIQKELALVKSSFASLTREDGSYVQVAGGPGLFLLEHKDSTGHRRAFQINAVASHPDGTTLECSAGSIPMNRTDWLLRSQVAEVFLAFSGGSPCPTFVRWRESPHAKRL